MIIKLPNAKVVTFQYEQTIVHQRPRTFTGHTTTLKTRLNASLNASTQTNKQALPLPFGVLGIFSNPPCFFLSTAFARKAWAELVSIQLISKFGPIYPAASFFEGVHSNKQNKHISPSTYCLEYLVSITLRSFSAILHVSSS